MQPTLVPELEAYQNEINGIRKEFRTLTEGLNETQLTWRPAPGNWSIAECITHLNLFGQQVAGTVQEMIAEAKVRNLKSQGPYRRNWLGDLLIRTVEPPYRLKFKAVNRLQPTQQGPASKVIHEFEALQTRLESLLKEANGLDLGKAARPLPPTNLRLTLSQWLSICLAHERRHLWQAKQITQLPAFPRKA